MNHKSAYNLFVTSLKNREFDKRLDIYCGERRCNQCIFDIKDEITCPLGNKEYNQFMKWENRLNKIKERVRELGE